MFVTLIATALLCGATGVTAATKPNVTLCGIPDAGDLIPSVLVARHAVTYYAARFPGINWDYQMFGEVKDSPTNFVRAWVNNASDLGARGSKTPITNPDKYCDVLIGPGFSQLASSMGPVVEVPWMGTSSSSTALSDKALFPTFSRIIPSDDIGAGGAAATALALKWTAVNVLCVDDPYGVSAREGFISGMLKKGGSVDLSTCIARDSGEAEVTAQLAALQRSNNRVVFLSLLLKHPASQRIVAKIIADNMYEHTIFVFSEAACSVTSAGTDYKKIPGALCATYRQDSAVMLPFAASYHSRANMLQDAQDLNAMTEAPIPTASVTTATYPVNQTDLYAMLTHDAVLHVMRALGGSPSTINTTDRIALVRANVTMGVTGKVELNATTGDRIAADIIVFNVDASETERTIAMIDTAGTFSWLDPADSSVTRSAPPPMQLLGRTWTTVPSGLREEGSSSGVSTALIGAVVGVGALLLIGIIAAVVLVCIKVRTRNTEGRYRPRNPTGFAAAVVDVDKAALLWAARPELMSEAMGQMYRVIRELAESHKGYEAKPVGEGMLIVFRHAADAVRFGVAVQESLNDAVWDAALGQYFNECDEAAGKSDAPKLWRGLRCRVAVDWEKGTITQTPFVRGGYDFNGVVVQRAVLLAGMGSGGQTIVSHTALNAANSTDVYAQFDVSGLNAASLIGEEIRLHQVLPKSLKGRTFAPLVVAADTGAGALGGFDNGSSIGRPILDPQQGRRRLPGRVVAMPDQPNAFDPIDSSFNNFNASSSGHKQDGPRVLAKAPLAPSSGSPPPPVAASPKAEAKPDEPQPGEVADSAAPIAAAADVAPAQSLVTFQVPDDDNPPTAPTPTRTRDHTHNLASPPAPGAVRSGVFMPTDESEDARAVLGRLPAQRSNMFPAAGAGLTQDESLTDLLNRSGTDSMMSDETGDEDGEHERHGESESKLLSYFKYSQRLVAPLKERRRAAVVEALAKAWHCPIDTTDDQTTLMHVILRVMASRKALAQDRLVHPPDSPVDEKGKKRLLASQLHQHEQFVRQAAERDRSGSTSPGESPPASTHVMPGHHGAPPMTSSPEASPMAAAAFSHPTHQPGASGHDAPAPPSASVATAAQRKSSTTDSHDASAPQSQAQTERPPLDIMDPLPVDPQSGRAAPIPGDDEDDHAHRSTTLHGAQSPNTSQAAQPRPGIPGLASTTASEK